MNHKVIFSIAKRILLTPERSLSYAQLLNLIFRYSAVQRSFNFDEVSQGFILKFLKINQVDFYD